MKNITIFGLTTVGLVLASWTASATSDNGDYPAAYYQPKVIYVDKAAVTEPEKTNCEPKPKQTEFDPKYPAASYEPKVVYP